MRVLFWGTPEFAVPSLRALVGEGFEIIGVVTQPDRPAGRGRHVTPSAVKQVALDEGLTVLTPDRPRGEEFMSLVRDLRPDVSVVVAYGHILTREVLDLPRLGSINVHASLLPKLRGAAPINWAIARGHEETGVTVMRMVEAMDAGPILHQVPETILPDETAGELTVRLSEVGAAALVEALAFLDAGVAEEVEQDHEAATYAPKIHRDTARIDWSRPAREVSDLVRAMDPVPGPWTTLNGESVKLFRPAVEDGDFVVEGRRPENGSDPLAVPVEPGLVLSVDPAEGVRVAAGEGAVLFREAQPPGKRRMRAADWINGRGVTAGQRFA